MDCRFGRARPQPARRGEGAPLGFSESTRCRTARRSLPAIIARPADITEATTPVRSASKAAGIACRVCFYSHRSKVNRHNVKCCLRAPINRCGRQTNNAVWPQAMNNVREPSERRASAQRSHQSQRKEVAWKLQRRKDWWTRTKLPALSACHSLLG